MNSHSNSLKKADFIAWNNDPFVTFNQFIYLAAGYEPHKNGLYESDYLKLPNKRFIKFYDRVKRIKCELPHETTRETEVLNSQQRDPSYEAIFLVKLARSHSIQVDHNYNPMMSDKRRIIIENERTLPDIVGMTSELETDNELIKKIKSSKIYAPLLWLFEQHYRDKSSFDSAKKLTFEIAKKYSAESNKDNDEIHLSQNECEFLNNFMRMIHGIKKTR